MSAPRESEQVFCNNFPVRTTGEKANGRSVVGAPVGDKS